MNKPGLVGLFQPHFALEIDHYFSLILHWTRLWFDKACSSNVIMSGLGKVKMSGFG